MTWIKRPAAVFGFSLLAALLLLMRIGFSCAFVFVPLLSAATVVLLARRSGQAPYLLTVTAAFLCAVILLTGFDRLKYAPASAYLCKNAELSGAVADYPESRQASQSVVLKNCTVNGKPTRYSVRVYYTDGSFPHPGDKISVTVSEIFSTADEDSRFYYQILSNGTWLSAFSRESLRVVPSDKRSPLDWIAELRYGLKNRFNAYMSSELASVCSAILTGDQTDVPDDVRQSIQKSGVSHLFAVSGMHLSVWAAVIFTAFGKRFRNRLIPNLAVLVFILFYVFFTGCSPSVIRAGIMLSLVCIGSVIRKHADAVNSLGLSAALMLFLNPWLAGNISFLFSVTATFAILWLYPLLTERKKYQKQRVKRFFRTQKEALLLSVVVICACIPFTAYYFGYVSALAPAASLACAPLAELLMLFSAAGLMFPVGGIPAKGIFTVAAALSNAILKIAEGVASLEFAILPLQEIYVSVWALVSVAALVLLISRKASRAAILNTMLGVVAAALAAGVVLTGLTASDYTVHIPQSGNSVMVAVTSGTGSRSLLLGCGGDYQTTSHIKNYLQAKTVFTPDYVIVPRNSKPQASQLTAVLKDLRPDVLIVPADYAAIDHQPEKTVVCSAFESELWEGVRLRYENDAAFCAGLFEINGTKLVFCLYPASDFKEAHDAYLSGDYLICRGVIPEALDTSRFENVIVLSDKSALTLGLPQNAVSTADSGDITLTLRRRHSNEGS